MQKFLSGHGQKNNKGALFYVRECFFGQYVSECVLPADVRKPPCVNKQ